MQISNTRTAQSIEELYQPDCVPPGSSFNGVGAIHDGDGVVLDLGRLNGSVVIQHSSYASISLSTAVFAIIARTRT